MFGHRLQKLSVHAGFTCPNRDGTKSRTGCSYCNNAAFSPGYCSPDTSVTRQLDEGVHFFSKRHPAIKYLAYFQSYSNTYSSLGVLKRVYEEALAHPLVTGLVIGTRPDCVDTYILDYIAELASERYVTIEYGIESTLDATLQSINRQHTYKTAMCAVEDTKKRGIHVGAHIILGLPGESTDDLLGHASKLSALPLDTLKIHHLQVLKNTRMQVQYQQHPEDFSLFSIEAYLQLLTSFLQRLRPDIALERFVNQSPEEFLIAPRWGLKNFEFAALLKKHMIQMNAWQGQYLT